MDQSWPIQSSSDTSVVSVKKNKEGKERLIWNRYEKRKERDNYKQIMECKVVT